jgi:hypothetical protein
MVSIDRRVDLSQYSLTAQQKTDLIKAKTSDEVVSALTKDGNLDVNEQKLLDEIIQELTASTDQTIKLVDGSAEANTVMFGKPVDFQQKLESKLDTASMAKLKGTTADRTSFFSRVDNKQDLSRVLRGDQKLVDEYYKINKGAHVLNGKILLQDAALLGRFNLLAPAEKAFIQEALAKCDNKTGINNLTADDVKKLDNIVERALAQLDGTPPPPSQLGVPENPSGQLPERMLVDDAALAKGDDFSALHDNYDNLLSASDAAINDANLAVHETGRNRGDAVANKVEYGYSYNRIQQSIKELDHQSENIDRALTLGNDQLKALRQEIETRTATVTAAGEDPEKDPTLQMLKNTAQSTATKMETLIGKAKEIQTARQKFLTQAKSRNVVASETDKRLAAIGEAQKHLAHGCQVLEHVRSEAEQIVKEAQGNPEAAKAKLAPLNGKLNEVNGQMITALKKLIDVYEKSPTANAKEIELLKAEVKTLEALKSNDSGDVQAKVQALTASRERIIQAMQPMVAAGLIDHRELKQLTTLDRQVTDFSGTHFAAAGDLSVYNASVDQMIEAGKKKDEGIGHHTSLLEDNKSWLGKAISYGSHVQMRLNITGGIGGNIGVAHAQVGAGITAGVRFGREFVGDPNREYQLRFDIGVMAEASAGIKGLFEVDAEFRASLQGGIAFATVGEVEKFMQNFADGASAVMSGDMDAAKAKVAEMKQMIASKYFAGTLTAGEAKATIHLPGHDNELVFKGVNQVSSQNFADGATNETTTNVVGGKIELGHGAAFGLKYTSETAKFTPPGSHTPIETHHKVANVTFSVGMLDKLLKTHMHHGNFGKAIEAADPAFKEALIAGLSQLGVNAGAFLGAFDSQQALSKLGEMVRLAKVKGESEIMIGFEWEPHHAIEIGLEGEYSASAQMQLGGGAYAKIAGTASYELAVAIPLPGGHGEGH